MSRIPRLAAILAVGALMLSVAPGAASAKTDGPTATASKRCSTGDGRGFGTTYVLSITTKRVKCRKAKAVVRAFHKCRKGASGRCGHKVKRFKCSENRFNVSSFQYDSNVTCKRGRKRVKHTYTQNT
jgi:hypothetical protein